MIEIIITISNGHLSVTQSAPEHISAPDKKALNTLLPSIEKNPMLKSAVENILNKAKKDI